MAANDSKMITKTIPMTRIASRMNNAEFIQIPL
jgi:hypothetical protein